MKGGISDARFDARRGAEKCGSAIVLLRKTTAERVRR
jgi:hypothetical protein